MKMKIITVWNDGHRDKLDSDLYIESLFLGNCKLSL